MKTMKEFRESFKAARRVSTPLVAIRTSDPESTIRTIQNQEKPDKPVLHWDIVRGLVGVNESGRKILGKILNGQAPEMVTARPVDALNEAAKVDQDGLIFFANAHRFMEDVGVVQAVWNLRGLFKERGNMLVLLGTPGCQLPEELAQDVFVLDEPLPSSAELAAIVQRIHTDSGVAAPSEEVLDKAVDALIGLAEFPADQVTAMSMTKRGVDLQAMWERKRQVIEQTPGLSVWRGGETFDEIGGCDNIKTFLNSVIGGIGSPRVIVFMDEIEKAFAGSGSDSSGVKTEMTGTLLTWMQDNEADGCIFIGPPGAAKSAIAKATGNTAGVPTIAFDLSAMQDSLVGASGNRLRAALKVVSAVSQGRCLFIATCNMISSLPPELRRRFTLGTFYFDLPVPEEREAIWQIYEKKFSIGTQPRPEDSGWTGAEIKECCRKAYRLKISLVEASTYIVPVSRSAAREIEQLRKGASGRFISASYPGVYLTAEDAAQAPAGRKIRLAEGVN